MPWTHPLHDHCEYKMAAANENILLGGPAGPVLLKRGKKGKMGSFREVGE